MMLPGAMAPVDALRGLGLFTLALVMGVRYVPALWERRRAIGVAALVIYFGGGMLLLVVGYLL